jgi:hypothetical protein
VHRVDVNVDVIGGGGIDTSGRSTTLLPSSAVLVRGELILPSGEEGNKRKILTMTTTTQWERRWRRWKRKGAVVVVAVNNKEEVAFVVAVDPSQLICLLVFWILVHRGTWGNCLFQSDVRG